MASRASAHQRQARTEDSRGSSRWTEADVRRLMELWSKNLKNDEIARLMGREKAAIAVKASRLNLPSRTQLKSGGSNLPKLRPCLGCQNPFYSHGPGNRFCEVCKEGENWRLDKNFLMAGG